MEMKIMWFSIRTCKFLFGRFFTPVLLMKCEIQMNPLIFFGTPALQPVV